MQEYFEMSGTSMASPIVAATAALMLEQDPSLNPGTVKARLMMSARKAAVGDPLVSGAGSLDILGALRATGTVADAPSPRAVSDVERPGSSASRTPRCSGGTTRSRCVSLWADSVDWTDPTAYLPAVVCDGRRDCGRRASSGRRASCGPRASSGPRARCGRTTPPPGSAIRSTSDGRPGRAVEPLSARPAGSVERVHRELNACDRDNF